MYKKIIFTAGLIIACMYSFSQREVSSPYSRFGYGDLYSSSLIPTQTMGGISNSVRFHNKINFANPAHHSAIKKETFLFHVGVGHTAGLLRQSGESAYVQKTGVEYFAFAFPVIANKWGSSVGLLPFNSVGYSIASIDSVASYSYQAKGGINQVVWGNSFSPITGLSVGFNAAFLFGTTIYNSSATFTSDNFAYHTKKELTYSTHGLLWDFGLQYVYPISDAKQILFGASYRDKQTLAYNKKSFLGSYTDYTIQIMQDTILNSTEYDNRTDVPQKVSIGLGYQIDDKLKVGIDAGYENWNRIYVYKQNNPNLSKEEFVKIGCEIIPNKRSSKYFNKLPYRFGIHYKNLPISYSIQSQQVNPIDFGISFGTELLLRQTANSLNFGVVLGKKVDIQSDDAFEEMYMQLKLNISLQETWFFKRKID